MEELVINILKATMQQKELTEREVGARSTQQNAEVFVTVGQRRTSSKMPSSHAQFPTLLCLLKRLN